MNKFVKGLFAALALRIVRDYRTISLGVIKIEAVRKYVKSLNHARLGVLALLLFISALLFFVGAAAVAINFTAVIIVLQVVNEQDHNSLLWTGIISLVISVGGAFLLVRIATWDRLWMRLLGADKLVAKVTKQ